MFMKLLYIVLRSQFNDLYDIDFLFQDALI